MQHALRLDAPVVLEHVDDHPRALVLVLQVRRVDEDQLVGLHRQVDVLLEDGRLVGRVLVEADLADAEHVRASSRNSGIMAMTSRDSATFSASLALMHSQE